MNLARHQEAMARVLSCEVTSSLEDTELGVKRAREELEEEMKEELDFLKRKAASRFRGFMFIFEKERVLFSSISFFLSSFHPTSLPISKLYICSLLLFFLLLNRI